MDDPLLSSCRFDGWRQCLVLLCLAVVFVSCESDGSTAPADDPSPALSLPDTMTVAHVLRTDDRFSTLVAALDSVGLDTTLTGSGPFTLFAPPNDAFEGLPDGTVEVLLNDRPDRLRSVLSHHIVQGRIRAHDLSRRRAVTTMNGDSLAVGSTDSTITVGTATIVDDDVDVANGLIHVIDHVLRPPETDRD